MVDKAKLLGFQVPSLLEVLGWFEVDEKSVPGDTEILYAYYERECYEGDAYVLLRYGGRLYEVYGSHCSCYGLEDQWNPEETSLVALRFLWEARKKSHAQEHQKLLLTLLDWLEAGL